MARPLIEPMNPSSKRLFCEFIIDFIFKKFNVTYQKKLDALILKNVELIGKNRTSGFIFNNENFIHSEVAIDNFERQRFIRKSLDIPHEKIIPEILELVEMKSKTAIDEMRFKGLINGILSTVKTETDFCIVFNGMFVPEIAAFNDKYSTNYGDKNFSDPKNITLTASDMSFIEDTKAKFKVSYDRYRVLTDLLGL